MDYKYQVSQNDQLQGSYVSSNKDLLYNLFLKSKQFEFDLLYN